MVNNNKLIWKNLVAYASHWMLEMFIEMFTAFPGYVIIITVVEL